MLNEKITSLLNNVEGEFGVYFEDIQDHNRVIINGNLVFCAASTIKIPLVALVLKEYEEGKFDINDKVDIKLENRVGGTGVIRNLDKSFKPTILDLINLALVVSDNIATNQLIDIVGGFGKINEFNQSIGLNNTKFQRKMLDLKSLNEGLDNCTTAKDLGTLLTLIAEGKCVSKKSSELIIKILKTQQFRQKLPNFIPAVTSYDANATNELPDEGKVMVANKTGDLWKTQHDVGIFILPKGERYVVAVYSQKLSEDYEGIEAISKISKIVYDYMLGKYNY